MSRFFVGDDFSGVEVLDDSRRPDAMGFAFPNGRVVDTHDVPGCQPGSLVIGRAMESEGLRLVRTTDWSQPSRHSRIEPDETWPLIVELD